MADDLPMLYDRVGEDFFGELVAAFYEGIATDELLAPLYPDYPDFEPAKERLRLFLIQYWGGPTTYMETRGHPRLRMRHMPFRVGEAERDRWLVHMAAGQPFLGFTPPRALRIFYLQAEIQYHYLRERMHQITLPPRLIARSVAQCLGMAPIQAPTG